MKKSAVWMLLFALLLTLTACGPKGQGRAETAEPAAAGMPDDQPPFQPERT